MGLVEAVTGSPTETPARSSVAAHGRRFLAHPEDRCRSVSRCGEGARGGVLAGLVDETPRVVALEYRRRRAD